MLGYVVALRLTSQPNLRRNILIINLLFLNLMAVTRRVGIIKKRAAFRDAARPKWRSHGARGNDKLRFYFIHSISY